MDWTSGANGPMNTYSIDKHWDVQLDPECVFWALTAQGNESAKSEAQDLHRRVAQDLDARLHSFRFGTHVTALYVNPNDACHANCSYCYIPPEIRRNGARMDKEKLTQVLEKARAYFSARPGWTKARHHFSRQRATGG